MHKSLLQFQDCWQRRGQPRPGVTSICWNSRHTFSTQHSASGQNEEENLTVINPGCHRILKSILGWKCATWATQACVSAVTITKVNIWLRKSRNVTLVSHIHKGCQISKNLHRQSPSSSGSSSKYLSLFSVSYDSDDSRYQILFAEPHCNKYLIKYFQPW